LRGEVLNDLTGVTGLFEVDDEDFPEAFVVDG
jgi:hypothetical protein